MKHFYIMAVAFTLLIHLKAGTAIMQMQVPAVVYAEETFNISCSGNAHDFKHVPSPMITLEIGNACSNHKSYNVKEVQRIFTVTCKTGNHTVKCITNAKHGDPQPIELHVIERPPKIINQPHNITTDIGLPVTLTCYVEGDPNHYWVGWMSRHAIIQGGEEHSISTSPNFKSTNGTIHHLTIHSVKETGKYECQIYTIAGDIQAELTHHVSVTDHDDSPAEATSLWDILKEFFF